MLRRLLTFELKKIWFSPIMISLVLMCLVFNLFLIGLYQMPIFHETPSSPPNVFSGLDGQMIAESRIDRYGVNGAAAGHIREKYFKLQPVIDQKALEGDALSVYLGSGSPYLHSLLFHTVLRLIWGELILLALAVTLLSLTYENLRDTEAIVYSSLIGRRLPRIKLAASIISLIGICLALLVPSLGVFFSRFDFSSVWGENVSSGFNFAPHAYGSPLITWKSYTFGGYFWSVIGLGIGLALLACLIGFVLGQLFRSAYLAFSITSLFLGLPFVLKPLFGIGTIIRSALNLTPFGLWLYSGSWLSDGPADIIWSQFEMRGLIIGYIIGLTAAIVSSALFKRKEIL